MTGILKHYHRAYLALGSEEKHHPHAGYAYFVTTEAGAAAMRQPKASAPKTSRRKLASAPSRLAELPPRLGLIDPSSQG